MPRPRGRPKSDLIPRIADSLITAYDKTGDRQLAELNLREHAAKVLQRELGKHVKEAVETVVQIMRDPDAPHGVRLTAARDVLDRTGGKAVQQIEDNSAAGTNAAMLVSALRDLAKAASSPVKQAMGTVIDHDPT